MSKPISIMWFRRDLRVTDNPALREAVNAGNVLPIFILDDETPPAYQRYGAASRVWLHYSLNALNESLEGKLSCFNGATRDIFKSLFDSRDIVAVYTNRAYEKWRTDSDKAINKLCDEHNAAFHSFNGSLLWEPWDVEKKSGGPYQVFTPFFKKGCLQQDPPREPLNARRTIDFSPQPQNRLSIDELELLPDHPWDDSVMSHWTPGEDGAAQRLESFIEHGLDGYQDYRNIPSKPLTSHLSPHLHWGEISPNQAWYAIENSGYSNKLEDDVYTFKSELGWREFSYSLLYYNPDMAKKNLHEKFNDMPWRNDKKALNAWKRGQTGCPIVDAGMRQLWQTGYMHNRVRMIVGSFLVKNLLIDWREGEAWFWDCLVDADPANNSNGWQWIAGSGADAAPFFRIFNPVTQGERYDPDGEYVKKYVPELKNMPKKHIHNPSDAPYDVLHNAGVRLDETYPRIIVDLKSSRQRALDEFKKLS